VLGANSAEVGGFLRYFHSWPQSSSIYFTAIELPAFKQIFGDIPGITFLFTHPEVVASRTDAEFGLFRKQLIGMLATTSETIALPLDV
jgi:hypothetical protein